ncbi:T9SS type A sorting domain-containing protein [uncultured Parabacteroides sp.]|uniref:T9SS type A sorting domain-containing protein n=1 Tax=uncultured Parabacteroides sp. TaxID=512312 RepID=UPI0025FCB16E|nr:T9SS type A sorting domain-containing protein [uncultured Parabacteroides sp.]
MSKSITLLIAGCRLARYVTSVKCNYGYKPFIPLFFLLLMTFFSIQSTTAREVSTVAELQTAVSGATEGEVITLSGSFVFGNATLAMPTVNVTVDGEGKVWKGSSITVNGTGDKTLTIRNIKMDGDGVNNRLFNNTASNGKLVLEKMDFYNSTGGGININTSGNASTVISYARIYDNTVVNSAAAIWVAGTSKITIKNSTIANNVATGAGYECGAISSKNFMGDLVINNTVFRKNKNKCLLSGPFGGGGGAMAMHYFYGNMTINECLFQENETNGEGINIENTFDGGAIYIIDAGGSTYGATLNINKTTFDSNLAHDDGGAMMIQVTGTKGMTTNITSCTFYNNVAYGLNGANVTGGAIQFFKNGGSSIMNNILTGCTFVGNVSGDSRSQVEQRGGAIGLSGNSSWGIVAGLTNNGCLYLGNKVYNASGVLNTASNYKDISNSTTVAAGTRNVLNVDKGNTPAYTEDAVLGKNFRFSDNLSGIKAGVDDEIVKTIPIKPEGIADNSYNYSATLPTTDQRNFKNYKDQGAIEMSWVKYNANGGVFGLTPQIDYVGEVYYEATSENKATDYYTIGTIDGKTTVVDGQTTLKASLTGKAFKGWALTANAAEPDPTYTAGKSLTYAEDNLTLYAVWGDAGYDLTYHSNFSPDQTYVQLVEAETATVATYPATSLPNRPNYIFLKWTTKADGTGIAYQPGTTFTITENTDLYAQWEPNSSLKLQWSVSKTTADSYEFSDVDNNSTTTVMVGTPVYVQIRPVGLEHVDFDTWAIEYIATPVDYHYPMGEAIGKTLRYDFNKGEAHTLEGTYYYNVTKLLLYKGGAEVATYIYRNASCTHKVVIQDKPVVKDPALQWSVSTVTSEQPYFKDVDDQSITSVNYGTPVFVQIRPVGHEGINFERWAVEYTVTPAEHYYGMNPTLKTERHNFNNREAHTEKGTYIYTVTKLTLYDMYGNQTVETYDYANSPYRHTIVIGDGEGPGPGPGGALQWSVSTASNKLEDFRDVDNLTTTTVTKGTPVYVQIRPVGFNNVTYDSWKIEYTATPAGYHYPLDEAVLKTERYTFNKGEAHTLVGTYIYNVHKLTLYNGESIATERYYNQPAYQHTIVITDEGMVYVGETAPYCSVDGEFRIPVSVLNPDYLLEYAVRFPDEAIAAGFSDTEYQDLIPGYIIVPVANRIPRGIYHANIYVRLKSEPDREEVYPFNIEVLETTTITRQPQSVNVCDGDAFTLSVEATGVNLSYQWFFNEVAIPGATSDSYTVALTPDKEGIYYVDVYGDCGMESSRTVTVGKNSLRIQVKWNEFLYITNQDNEFVRFQWYKDGQKIDKNGTSIYYSVPEGLLGTYYIQAYRADDTYVVSCPITFDTLTQFPITRVYPAMVKKNMPITVSLGTPGEAPESAMIEIYNMNGQLLERLTTLTTETTIPADVASGSYVVKVTTETGKSSTHKIIVK